MKHSNKILVILLLSLFAIPYANAQMKYGVKADLTFSKMPFSEKGYSSGNLIGFRIGAVGEFGVPFVPVFVEGGILYTQTGTTISKDKEDLDLKNQAIQVPFNLKFKFDIIPSIRAFVKAGPDFTFNLSNNTKDIKSDLEKIGLGTADTNVVNVGVHAGLGVELMHRLEISAQYEMALSKDYKYDGVGELAKNFYDTKAKTISLSATVFF